MSINIETISIHSNSSDSASMDSIDAEQLAWIRIAEELEANAQEDKPLVISRSRSPQRPASMPDIGPSHSKGAAAQKLIPFDQEVRRTLLANFTTDADLPSSTLTRPNLRSHPQTSIENLAKLTSEVNGFGDEMVRLKTFQPNLPLHERKQFVTQVLTTLNGIVDAYYDTTKPLLDVLLGRFDNVMQQYKTLIDRYEVCILCAESKKVKEFPVKVTSDCHHTVYSCFECLKRWIETTISERGVLQLKCLECNGNMSVDDVRAIASEETYQRYIDLSVRVALNSVDNFFWCLNPRCSSGQIHYGGARFECVQCKEKTCVRHGLAWHEGETCAEYDERTGATTAGPDASEQLKSKLTRACPNCSAPIEKDGGCSHMNCTKCDLHFSWEDAPPYFVRGYVWERDLAVLFKRPSNRVTRSRVWILLARLVPGKERRRAAKWVRVRAEPRASMEILGYC